jgi:beta-galactosidase
MPRQDGGNNGNVKGYKIQISADGKNWSDPVVEGEFPYSADKQTVLFKAPVKARFVRFTATSSQNGQDFASGAEFELIKE